MSVKMALSAATVCYRVLQFSPSNIIVRCLSTSSVVCGKRNFRKFPYFNRGTSAFHEKQKTDPDPNIPVVQYGRDPGVRVEKNQLKVIPEMIPELIVPDLKDCPLKPYVSYRAPDINEPKFTAKDLFYAVYSQKIERDLKEGNIGPSGEPRNPSPEESLTAEEARIRAVRIGADIFTDEENVLNSEHVREGEVLDKL